MNKASPYWIYSPPRQLFNEHGVSRSLLEEETPELHCSRALTGALFTHHLALPCTHHLQAVLAGEAPNGSAGEKGSAKPCPTHLEASSA